jgi:hypothetical protein
MFNTKQSLSKTNNLRLAISIVITLVSQYNFLQEHAYNVIYSFALVLWVFIW